MTVDTASLLDLARAKQARRRPRAIDEIYPKLTPEQQAQVLTLLANKKEFYHATIADVLTDLGHPISASAIAETRKTGWTPA